MSGEIPARGALPRWFARLAWLVVSLQALGVLAIPGFNFHSGRSLLAGLLVFGGACAMWVEPVLLLTCVALFLRGYRLGRPPRRLEWLLLSFVAVGTGAWVVVMVKY